LLDIAAINKPVAGFGISGDEHLGSATTKLAIWCASYDYARMFTAGVWDDRNSHLLHRQTR